VTASRPRLSKGLCCTATCSTPIRRQGRPRQTRFGRAVTARCPRRAHPGKLGWAFVTANARGPYASQEERGLEAGAEAISWMCPYAVCLVAEFDKQSWLREALPPVRSLSKEGRGTRWTGAWPTDVPNRSKSSPLSQAARAFRTRLFAAKLRVAKGAVGDEKADSRRAGCATPRLTTSRPGRPKGCTGPEEELSQGHSTGYRVRDRRSRERKKSNAPHVERRRSGPGKALTRHGVGVEAVSAGLSESEKRAPRKARPGIEGGSRQERQR